MRLNPFKKDPAKKEAKQEKDAIYDEVKAQIEREISEIEKVADREERIARYEALTKKLQGVYSDGKPDSMDSAGIGAGLGGLGGLAVGMFTSLGFLAATPLIGPGAFFGIWGIGTAVGAGGGAGLAGLFGDKERRKELRAKYGSVRNAQAIYKLQKAIEKDLEKDKEVIRLRESEKNKKASLRAHDAKLREEFNKSFKKEETPSEAPAATAPEKAPAVKLVLPSSNKSKPLSP